MSKDDSEIVILFAVYYYVIVYILAYSLYSYSD